MDTYKLLRKQKQKQTLLIALLAALVVILGAVCLFVGSSNMTLSDCVAALLRRGSAANVRILWNIRIPRVLAAVIAFSRLYLYVHWPSDVAGGMVITLVTMLLGIGLSHEISHGSLRLTLGMQNTEEDVDYILERLEQVVKTLRAMSPIWKD